MAAAAEKLAYVAMLNPDPQKPDALAVVDVDPASRSFGQLIGQVDMTGTGDELHHFGWNACSSCLCPVLAAPAHGAALPRGAGHAFVAHPRARHQARIRASHAS